MVKAYLRYKPEDVFGVIASSDANTVCDQDGRNVITSCNEILSVWDPRKSKLHSRFRITVREGDLEFHHHITRIERHPTLPHVAAGYDDGSIRIWDINTGQMPVSAANEGPNLADECVSPNNVFYGHKSAVTALSFSNGGHLLATGGRDSDIVIWDIIGNMGLYRLLGHTNSITCLRFVHTAIDDPQYKCFTDVGADGIDQTLETSQHQHQRIRRLKTQPRYIVSCSKDTLVKIWDMSTQWCIQTIVDHPCEVYSLCINPPETRLVTGGADSFLRVYKLECVASSRTNDEVKTVDDTTTADEIKKKDKHGEWYQETEAPDSDDGPLTIATYFGAIARQSAKGSVVSVNFAYDLPYFIENELKNRSDRNLTNGRQLPPRKKRKKNKTSPTAVPDGHLLYGDVSSDVNTESELWFNEAIYAYMSKSRNRSSTAGYISDNNSGDVVTDEPLLHASEGSMIGRVVNGAVAVGGDEMVAIDMTCVLIIHSSRKILELFTLNDPTEGLRRKRRRRMRKLETLKKRLKEIDELSKFHKEADMAMRSKNAKKTSNGIDTSLLLSAETKKELNELVETRITIVNQLDALKVESLSGDDTALTVSDEITPIRILVLGKEAVSVDFHNISQQLCISYKSNSVEVWRMPLVKIVAKYLQSRKERRKNTLEETEANEDPFLPYTGIGRPQEILDAETSENENTFQRLSQPKISNDINSHVVPAFESNTRRLVWEGHPSIIRTLSFSHSDSMILSTELNCVKIWNIHTRRCVREFTDCGHALCGMFVAGDSHVVIGNQEGDVRLYHVNAAECFPTDVGSKYHTAAVQAIAPHPRHTKFVTVSLDKTFKVFELCEVSEERIGIRLVSSHDLPDGALDASFSPNGQYIAISLLDNRMQVFHTDTFNVFLTLYGHKLPVASLAISTDGTILASGSADKSVKIWGLDFGNIKFSWQAHEKAVTRVAFMYDTHYLVSCGRDGIIKIWDSDTKDLCSQLLGHHKALTALTMSQDSDRIVTSGLDYSIRVWQRTSEQYFLEEEREKEFEAILEKDFMKDSGGTLAQLAPEVTSKRPSRCTMESIRTTENLMRVLDEAHEQLTSMKGYKVVLGVWRRSEISKGDSSIPLEPMPRSPTANIRLQGKSPHEHVMLAVCSLHLNALYEVLVALPFSYAEKLLNFLTEFFEALRNLDSDGVASRRTVAYPIEFASRVVLVVVHLHFRLLISSAEHRNLMLRLQKTLRPIIADEYEKLVFCKTSLDFLNSQLKLKRNESVTCS